MQQKLKEGQYINLVLMKNKIIVMSTQLSEGIG